MENPLFCDDNAALAPADPNVIVLDLESKIIILPIYLGIAPLGIFHRYL